MLALNLVLEGLYSLLEVREPAVARPRIQQTLRAVDDEVRAYAADAVRRFVAELSAATDASLHRPPERLLREVVVPFMKDYWPQERSLVTAGVSHALAGLPAVSREAFSDAVTAVERFWCPLIAGRSWTMAFMRVAMTPHRSPSSMIWTRRRRCWRCWAGRSARVKVPSFRGTCRTRWIASDTWPSRLSRPKFFGVSRPPPDDSPRETGNVTDGTLLQALRKNRPNEDARP